MNPTIDVEAHRANERRNQAHTMLLLAGIGGVLGVASLFIWGPYGLVLTILLVAALYLYAPRLPPEAMMKAYRARLVTPANGGQLAVLISQIAARAELPRAPSLYVIPSLTLNAFAVGNHNRSAIAITEGLLRRLSMRELAGVLAHEVSHIRNNDLAVLSLADTMTRLIQWLPYTAILLAVFNLLGLLLGDQLVSWWAIALLYLAPALTNLMQLALSRAREYTADQDAAALTGDPQGLASALRRLETSSGHLWEDLSMPVPGRRVSQPSLLRTHPQTSDRVARLLELATPPTRPPMIVVEAPMISLIDLGPIAMRPRHRFPGVWY